MMDISIFSRIPALKDLPASQLEWLLNNAEVTNFEPGEYLFKKGDDIDRLQIIVEGSFNIRIEQNGEFRNVATINQGDFTGNLPYSRARSAIGYAVASKSSTVVALHKDNFPEMIRDHHELTTVLVHTIIIGCL